MSTIEGTALEVENPCTSFTTDADSMQPVKGITFWVGKGESLGIVGEPGRGKGVAMLSIMGLLEDNAFWQADTLPFDDEDLLEKPPKEMREIQGNGTGMIFWDSMTSLNPLFTVGGQARGPLMHHQKLFRKEVEAKALAMLGAVGLPNPERRLEQYPHELSGGMCQRVMITIAMYCKPELLIADEPTTTLDMTIQAQILELMAHMKNEFNTSVTLTTYDLGVISSLCTRVIVMYGRLIMEEGDIEDVFYRTDHSYTTGLPASIPKRIKKKLVPIFDTSLDLLNPPKGYPFTTRYSCIMRLYAVRQPPFCNLDSEYINACWLHNESMKARMGKVKL